MYVIDEVHMLTKEAANALLKTLEEPPKHVIFCLATTEPEKLPITILSRCQRFDLHRIATNLIAQQLHSIATKEKLTLAAAAAHAIARGAEGGMRDAESMLDQLVAFCGEKIEEADVLNVFGFTSQQMVADFVGRILRGETADALALLHEECEAGKDMMKLMSDTIAYLRDLLVFKVKPDALSDEPSTETRAVFAEQAPLLETDRVLELIDQFAAAEGRMKWAPNKKLHFEVAVIRAIQTLDQTTLDEVIENLNALRDGNPVAAVPGRGSGAKAEVARAREPRTTKSVANDPSPTTDVNEIWGKVVAQIKTRRPFIKSWIEQAQKMQEKMAQAQTELAEKTVEVQAAGGKITVVANGAGDVISIKITKEIVDPEDVEFLEDAVLSGVKQAIEQGKAIASSEMSKITGGMGVPGLGL